MQMYIVLKKKHEKEKINEYLFKYIYIYIYTHRHPGVDRIWTFQKTQVNFLSSTLDFLVQDDNIYIYIYIHKQAISHSKNHTRVARKPQPLSNLKWMFILPQETCTCPSSTNTSHTAWNMRSRHFSAMFGHEKWRWANPISLVEIVCEVFLL